MSNTYFISDLHLGHERIIEFEGTKRPFATIEEHDQTIIDNWNSVIGDRDSVWVLGDVVFGKANLPKLAQLKGRKRLIMGNHDRYGVQKSKKVYEKYSWPYA